MTKKTSIQRLYIMQQFLYWSLYCILIGFSTVYFLDKGYGNATIGIYLALTNIISIFLQSIASKFSTTIINIKTLLSSAYAVIIALLVAAVISKQFQVIVTILFLSAQCIHISMLPFINSMGLNYETYYGNVNFSLSRGFGSLGFALTSYLLGRLIQISSSNLLFPIGVLFTLLIWLVLDRSPKTIQKVGKEKYQGGFLRKYPHFILIIVGFALVFIFHNFLSIYMPQIMDSVGGDASDVGLALMIAGLCELPVMFMYRKLSEKKSHAFWLNISMIMYCVRGIGLLFVSKVIGVHITQLLQLCSFALILPASSYYVNEIVDKEDQIQSQTFLTIAITIGGVGGTALGGILIQSFRVLGMLIFGFVILLLSFLCLIIHQNIMKKERTLDCEMHL